MTFNDAIMFCSDYNLKIAFVTNRLYNSFKNVVKTKSVWLIGFNSKYFNNDCMFYTLNLYKSNNCSELKFALCN